MRTPIFLLALICLLHPSAPVRAQGLNAGGAGVNNFTSPLSLYRSGEAAQVLGAQAAETQRLDVIDVLNVFFNTLTPRPSEAPLVRNVFINGDRAAAQVETRVDRDRATSEVRLRLLQGQWQVVRLTTVSETRR